MKTLATNKNERTNGFKCPLSCQQVGIWINCATSIASSVAWLMIPLAKDIFKEDDSLHGFHAAVFILILIAYAMSSIFTAVLAYKCTAAIPTDVLISK